MPIATINPATAETLKTFDPLTGAQIDARIERAAVTRQGPSTCPRTKSFPLAGPRPTDISRAWIARSLKSL